ncbi:MAG: DegV family protein [Anaerolineae bacterium]
MVSSVTALITDSTCDVPNDLVSKYGIVVVPAYIVWGDEVLRDGIDIQPEAFYERLERDREYPTTAHPTPEDFVEVYRAQREAGAQELVVITVSSAMSGTFEVAQQAAGEMDIPVHVVDSKGPSMSLGWQVLAAVRAREAGGDAQRMVAAAASVRERLVHYVSLDTLEYLHKGGRIGGATRFVGTLLRIKPLVSINHEKGEVEASGRARTRSRAVNGLYTTFFEALDTSRPLHVAVFHGKAREEAEELAARIRRDYAPKELLMDVTGPVLGVHTGPGALALSGYTET